MNYKIGGKIRLGEGVYIRQSLDEVILSFNIPTNILHLNSEMLDVLYGYLTKMYGDAPEPTSLHPLADFYKKEKE